MMSKKKIRFWYYCFSVIALIGLFAPITTIVIINWDKYVVQKNGMTVSMGGVLAVLMVVMLMKFGIKKFSEVFWSTMLLVIIYCLNSIIKDALPLTFCMWLGTVLFTLFKSPRNYFKKRLDAYVDESTRTYARQDTKDKIYRESGRC